MKVRDKMIEYLERNRGEFISGEQLARELSVSRAAVWKNMKKLQDEGFLIEAVTNKGYRLTEETDVLSQSGIDGYVDVDDIRIEVLKSVDSTNKAVKARAGEAEGLVIAACEQTGGIGRMGRSFYSPSDTGVYFSILLKPKIENSEITYLTIIAALAVCEAIETCSDAKPSIKWVNDVLVNGKKVCGILTQAAFDVENSAPEYVVVGIGINVYTPKHDFTDDIKNIAGVVLEKHQGGIKNRLVAETINRFFHYYKSFENKSFIKGYRQRSMLIGQQIRVINIKGMEKEDVARRKNEDYRLATALAIDDNCHLLVKYEDGTEEALSSGEVSVKVIQD